MPEPPKLGGVRSRGGGAGGGCSAPGMGQILGGEVGMLCRWGGAGLGGAILSQERPPLVTAAVTPGTRAGDSGA